MSHKTMIDGVSYEISGGKTLVDGTAYSIKNGKTLVGGTAYEVGFGKIVTITIGANAGAPTPSNPTKAYVKINGQTYDGSAEYTLSVPVGTIVTCYAASNVVLNGAYIGSTTNVTYEHEITTNTDFKIVSNIYVGWVYITEE